MRLSGRIKGGILVISLLTVSMLVHGGSVSAQANTEQSNNKFEYQVSRGQNMTLLARRTVQLYVASNDINLNNQRLVAAETYLVESLGPKSIDLNDKVEFSEDAVRNAIDKANNLTDAQASLWNRYLPVRTNLVNIKPSVAPANIDVNAVQSITDNSDDNSAQSDSDESSNISIAVNEEEPVVAAATSSQDAPWYWWLIGGGSLVALWYVLTGNDNPKNSNKKRSANRK